MSSSSYRVSELAYPSALAGVNGLGGFNLAAYEEDEKERMTTPSSTSYVVDSELQRIEIILNVRHFFTFLFADFS